MKNRLYFLYAAFSRERRCCLWLYCLPGDRKCKVIEKKRKSCFFSPEHFFCHVIWKPLTKRQMSWLGVQTFIIMNLEHIDIFKVYWGSRHWDQATGSKSIQGDFWHCLLQDFSSCINHPMPHLQVGRMGGCGTVEEESKFSSGLNSGSPSTCSHSDLMENYQTLFELHLWRDNNLYLAGLWWGLKNSNLPMFLGMVDSQGVRISSPLHEETLKLSESSYAWFPMVFLALNYHSFVYLWFPHGFSVFIDQILFDLHGKKYLFSD